MERLEEVVVSGSLGAYVEPPHDERYKFTQSFSARDWARAFVEHVEENPEIPLDEDCMVGWFANAIMRGWDEHARRYPKGEDA